MIGRTNDFILKKLNWFSIEERYQLTVQKLTHKMLNMDNLHRHFLAGIMTENRTIKMMKENKLGPKPSINRNDKYTMETFTYKSIDLYNRLDRRYTLLINNIKLKKCLNKLYANPKTIFKIKIQRDYDINCIKDYKSNTFYPCATPLIS